MARFIAQTCTSVVQTDIVHSPMRITHPYPLMCTRWWFTNLFLDSALDYLKLFSILTLSVWLLLTSLCCGSACNKNSIQCGLWISQYIVVIRFLGRKLAERVRNWFIVSSTYSCFLIWYNYIVEAVPTVARSFWARRSWDLRWATSISAGYCLNSLNKNHWARVYVFVCNLKDFT